MHSWKLYSEERPTEAGDYQWRLPLASSPGAFVLAVAPMRMCWAGHQQVLSPGFNSWDGSRLHVHPEAQWRAVPEGAPELDVDGVEHEPCPFCRKCPRFEAYQRPYGGGVVAGPRPYELNAWRLACCSWAKTDHFGDPVQLANERNSLLRARGGSDE